MCQLFNSIEAKKARTALDRVYCTEHLVDQIGIDIGAARFDFQQIAFNIAEVFLRFLNKQF